MVSAGLYWMLDDKGDPVSTHDVLVWGAWFACFKNRLIARDAVGDATVSTVFLGIDHGYGQNHTPVLFETMVFGGPNDGELWRYETKQAALDGHRRAVEHERKRDA